MPNPAKLRSAEVEASLEAQRRASDPRYMRKSERETLERHRAAKEPAGSRSRSRSRSRERDRGRGLGISPRGGGRGGGGGPSAPASSAVGTDGAAAGGSRAGLATHKSPRDGEPRAQQPAQEGAERRAEHPRGRRQPEPPARAGAKRGAFQDVGGPAGAPETAERLLFGNSPTLPLRRPDYACFPKLFRGQVLCVRAPVRELASLALCGRLCPGPSALTNLHAQLLKESIAACRVSMHVVHWCSVPSVREAAHRAFQEETQLNFVCRVPTSFLRDRYQFQVPETETPSSMHWQAAVLSLQV